MYIYRKRSKVQNALAKKGKVCPACNSASIELTEPGRDRTTFTCLKCGSISTFTKTPQTDGAPGKATTEKKQKYSMFSVRESVPPPSENPMTARFNALENETIYSIIEVIRKAMADHQILSFNYSSAKGKGFRSVEPYKLTVNGSDVVLFAHDLEGDGTRIFKLGSMSGAELQEYSFQPRHQVEDKLKDDDDDKATLEQK